MINFIICDDCVSITEKISKVISKIMMPIDIEYRINEFSKYNAEFKKLMNSKVGTKVYILDIEVGNSSGLDIARKIREKDWDSIIILISVHYELSYQAFKDRILILDFISKFDNYEKKIGDCVLTALDILKTKAHLACLVDNVMHRINFDDILYITRDEKTRKVSIYTYYNRFDVNTTLSDIEKKLNHHFIKTHRACIVNKNNIKTIDYNSNKIIFKNDDYIYLLARNRRKEVKAVCDCL